MFWESLFWVSVAGVWYPYFGYPLALFLLGRFRARPPRADAGHTPRISIIVPAHNEGSRLARKIANTESLDYPPGLSEVLYVSDGSTDDTVEIIKRHSRPGTVLIELRDRGGKAAALNAGLDRATGDVVVFTDASIMLDQSALLAIVRPFADPEIGCVSGEDRIAEADGEGVYGRYELFLRRQESAIASIVGASGCFYAQRRHLCSPFTEGMAPDFLSVLRTVEQGYRAISEPAAGGVMSSVRSPAHEFERKVRTLLRGMTALFANPGLLNPFRHGVFAFELWSHKVMRWTVPFFMLGAAIAPVFLLDRWFYQAALAAQAVFYLAALVAFVEASGLRRLLVGRVALFFIAANAAILVAWCQYVLGVRQELWTPSRR